MKQSEIWLINLDPTIGAEINKTRPAVIVNDNALGILPLKIIVPVTEWKSKYELAPWFVKIESLTLAGLSKISATDCFQIRSVSDTRLVKKIGTLEPETMDKIRTALTKVLSIQLLEKFV